MTTATPHTTPTTAAPAKAPNAVTPAPLTHDAITALPDGTWACESKNGGTYAGVWGYDGDGAAVLDCGCIGWRNRERNGAPCRHARLCASLLAALPRLLADWPRLSLETARTCGDCAVCGSPRLSATLRGAGELRHTWTACGCLSGVWRAR